MKLTSSKLTVSILATMLSMIPAFIAVTSMFLLTACNSGDDPQDDDSDNPSRAIELDAGEQAVADDFNDFAIRLFRVSMRRAESENAVMSPLSVMMTLGMLSNGVEGPAMTEIEEAFGPSIRNIGDVNSLCRKLLDALPVADKKSTVLLANSFWWNKSFRQPDEHMAILQKYYGAETQTADFGSPATLAAINDWCAKHTDNNITKILDDISPMAVAYWMNALYFKSSWSERFDPKKTTKQDFHTADGTIIRTDMMHGEHNVVSFGTEKFHGISMSYGNGSYKMTILIPQGYRSLDESLDDLTPEAWNEIFRKESEVNIPIYIPKFKDTSDWDMIPCLSDMGIKEIFSEATHPFKPLDIDACIALFKQKIVAETDEAGSTAAAVTIAGIEFVGVGPYDPTFRADYPFYYIISEKSTGAILIAGRMMRP